jgi:hypothetical protein
MVSDVETGLTLDIATIQLDSLADREMADLIRNGLSAEHASTVLNEFFGPQGITIAEATDIVIPTLGEGTEDYVKESVGHDVSTFLSRTRNIDERNVRALVDELFEATVLAEHSLPRALKGKGAVFAAITAAGGAGTAAAHGLSGVMIAVVHSGGLAGTGAAVMLFGPAGIVVIGAGAAAGLVGTAAWFTYKLLTHSR